ncbi:uncharacterized protein LOC142173494 [Nicotiana tabacum]|uniref:Uncharacterized protein LOC142173494 n=1 Tax=Nicotiana tabacum TaxID=4097 RepID=A0AC58TD92_TOBAC
MTNDVLNAGTEVCEILQANILIEKFSPSWSDYRNQLKHKKKKLTFQELISQIRTEEANRLKDKEAERLKDKMKFLSLNSSKANLVESASTFVKDMFKGKLKKGHVKKQNCFNKSKGQIQKSKGPCYVCGKIGHKAFQCNQRQGQSSKKGGKAQVEANLTESGDAIVVVVVEVNMVANKTDWMLDIGVSRHICANKDLFNDFEESTDRECVYMGDFVGEGYFNKGLFVLNIVEAITSNASTSNSAYIAESIDLWHEANFTKKPSKNVTSRNTELLELVHSDLVDFKNTVSKGGKKCYITFVDDFSRYTKVYLLKFKDEAESIITANDHENDLRRSKRRRIEASFGTNFITTFLTENIDLNLFNYEFVSTYLIEEDPKTYDEAMRGFNQKKGIDYFDTYSLVTKIATIRTRVALATIHNLVIHQMDVKTAFLNGDLEEEIYMTQPEGFVIQGQENKVRKLKKSLYGLKRVPKQWYEKFNSTLVDNEFFVNASDTCVYSKMEGSDCVIIYLYVDDMLIFGPNMDIVNETKNLLSSTFEMKDHGEADNFLGIKIKRTANGFSLSKSHYIKKMLKRFDCFDVAPVRTPYDPSIHLRKNKESSISQT